MVIADFGLASITTPITTCGTEGYMAPEILQNKERSQENKLPYTSAVDIYSLGILVFFCLGVLIEPGSVMDEGAFVAHIGRRIVDCHGKSRCLQERGAIWFASHMLAYNPKLRPNATQNLGRHWLDLRSYVPSFSVPDVGDEMPDFSYYIFELELQPLNNPVKELAIGRVMSFYLRERAPAIHQLLFVVNNISDLVKQARKSQAPGEDGRLAMVLERLPLIGGVIESPPMASPKESLEYHITALAVQAYLSLGESLAKDPVFREFTHVKYRDRIHAQLGNPFQNSLDEWGMRLESVPTRTDTRNAPSNQPAGNQGVAQVSEDTTAASRRQLPSAHSPGRMEICGADGNGDSHGKRRVTRSSSRMHTSSR